MVDVGFPVLIALILYSSHRGYIKWEVQIREHEHNQQLTTKFKADIMNGLHAFGTAVQVTKASCSYCSTKTQPGDHRCNSCGAPVRNKA